MTKADEQVYYRVELLTGDAEHLIPSIWGAGALGVEVQDHDTFMENDAIAPVPEGKTRIIAFYSAPFDESQLPDRRATVVSNARYDERGWETAWMKYFRPVPTSRRSIVGPPWEEFEAPADGVKVVIEPGMAFGTGTHETTGLCAELVDEELDRRPADASTVLDVGSGTGVLSMIAVGLGASDVAGVDVDENAVAIATENLRLNQMAGRARFSSTPLPRLGTFDIVVANILATILLRIQDDLVPRVRRGGALILSGITTEQVEGFVADFDAGELQLAERRDRGEWVALVFRRA